MVSKSRSRRDDVKLPPRQGIHAEESTSATPLVEPTPVSRPKRKRTAPKLSEAITEPEEQQPVPKRKKAKVVKATVAAAAIKTDLEVDSATGETVSAEEEQKPAKKAKAPRKPRAPKPEPVYVIPDVELKHTTFKGRLGYACLNTVLRSKKPAADSIFCSRTCRLDTVAKNGIEFAKDLGRRNVEDLLTMIQWNEDNNIRFLRISSEIFPFASHKIHGYSLSYLSPLLASVGALANKYGHRLTTHPGQYTQLGSPKKPVIEASIRELTYHCEMLDRMGIGRDGVMIVHGGGMYEDKTATLLRIKETITTLLPQNARDRLVLENDEICYNAEDLLPLCEELDVPLVFDYHHDSINPSSIPPKTIIERANAIWVRRGIKPKQHLSEARPGAVTLMERRAHADRCENLPVDLPDDMDLMIEAKDKEQAVLYLHRMYNLHPVVYESLRPADKNPTKETKGRKSTKRARAKAEKERVKEEETQETQDAEPKVVATRKTRAKSKPKPKIKEESVSESESGGYSASSSSDEQSSTEGSDD